LNHVPSPWTLHYSPHCGPECPPRQHLASMENCLLWLTSLERRQVSAELRRWQ
jgi:hypothetical protein